MIVVTELVFSGTHSMKLNETVEKVVLVDHWQVTFCLHASSLFAFSSNVKNGVHVCAVAESDGISVHRRYRELF